MQEYFLCLPLGSLSPGLPKLSDLVVVNPHTEYVVVVNFQFVDTLLIFDYFCHSAISAVTSKVTDGNGLH